MMKKLVFMMLLCVMGLLNAVAGVHEDFETRKTAVGNDKYFEVFSRDLTKDERAALEFLYAYMPVSDITDYNGDYWLRNVQASLKARKEMAWGKKVTDQMWRHFVLPVRVNNENMDLSREDFYKELKDRVKGLSMTQAALEINHWCHEKVTYTPADIRTSGPAQTWRSAFGRCGEESTFGVAAMRAMGIPARQVYTPRWAHTDDNHAWVEVWVDGKWHFLGACEPEAVLDLGWFNAPASRGMLMHTNAFGKYSGKEEIISRSNCYTEIDITDNYAPTASAQVKVVDEKGNAVADAKVEYKLYNYAELYSVATKYTDAKGLTSLSSGKGDLLAWVSKDGKFGLGKVTVGKDKVVTVKLDKDANFTGGFDFDLVPPPERNTIPYQTEEQIKQNKIRFAQEDSIRQLYLNTFHHGNKYVEASRGNWASIEKFLANHPDQKAEALLGSLSQKDLRDVPENVLEDHYNNTQSYIPGTEAVNFYMCPRVSNELLTPYRSYLSKQKELTQFMGNPKGLVDWVKINIKVDESWNPQSLCMFPASVFDYRTTDAHSRDIFFVAAARSIGLEARVDEVTGKTQYLQDGEWQDVKFEVENVKNVGKGVLKADYTVAANIEDPKYYSHFSISKIVDDTPQLLNYSEDGSCTWSTLLKNGTPMDAGQYLICSGNRMADGSVLCHLEFVKVNADKETDTHLVMRESTAGVQVIGNFNSEDIYNDDVAGKKSILSTTGRGYYVLGLISPNEEPTNHALKDIALRKAELEQWGQKIILLFKDKEEQARFTNRAEFTNLPNTIVWGTDVDGKITKEVWDNMKLTMPNRPVFLICDTFNRVVFKSQGYTIGLGEQLMSVIKKLEQQK